MCSVRSVKPAHAIDDFQPVCLIRFFRQSYTLDSWSDSPLRVCRTQYPLLCIRMPCLNPNPHLHMATYTCSPYTKSLARRRIFFYIRHAPLCALHTAQRESTARSRLTESTEGSCSHSVTSAARAPPLDSTTRWPRVRLEIDLVSGSPSCNRRTRHGVRELAGNHSGISYRASWASGHGRG